MSEDKDIILTVSIGPLKNGKRKVVVSGAPEQEMPVVKIGAFPDLHRLVDGVWVELAKREPQVVKMTAAKPAAKAKAKAGIEKDKEYPDAPGQEGESDEKVEGAEEAPAAQATAATETEPAAATSAPAKSLPIIEGDKTAPEQEQLTMEGLNG